MTVSIKEVISSSDIDAFVSLPFDIYKDEPNWIPPIIKDEKKALDKKHNPAYSFCDARFFLAYKNGKCSGRIGCIINKDYNEKVGIKFGRINRIEFYNDPETFDRLLDTAKKWFMEEHMEFIHGPLGFSNLDTQGLLVEGFDYLPSIASVFHPSYYKDHFERVGFEKENDWIEFRLTIGEVPYKKAKRGSEIILRRFGYELVHFKKRSELKVYAPIIFDVLNEAFTELPYVSHLNDSMVKLYTDKYFKILNPRFIKIVKKEDQVIGFFIGLPSLSEAMQKAHGNLFPFGFIHVLKALKKPQVIDMLLTGVRQEYQSTGVAVVLIAALQEEMLKAGIHTLETTGVFESNHNVIANWKNYKHIQHKRRRCYVLKIGI